jgi:hypothetical protein
MNFIRKSELYRLCAQDREDEAADLAMDIDDLLTLAQWEAVDGLLDGLDPTKLTVHVCLCILSITWPAKPHLPSRAGFFERCEPFFAGELGEERAKRLLENRR